jgi:hypothetical protein
MLGPVRMQVGRRISISKAHNISDYLSLEEEGEKMIDNP